MNKLKFTTIKNAKKETGLAYLGAINVSSKLMKNKKVSHNYTYAFYLAPAKQSGYNICPNSTPECRLGCLSTSGRAGMEILGGRKTMTKDCRIKKSKLFNENQEYFMEWLVAEINFYKRKAIKDSYDFSVRLNTTSDIDWTNVLLNGKNIFEIFPDIMFYDYTKIKNKMFNIIPNYQLTYSYTGRNEKQAMDILYKGMNIAVVFDVKKGKKLPETFKGFKVVDGDLTDARFLDEKNVVVGLRWKRIANKDIEKQILNSVFVVKPETLQTA